MSDIFYFWLHLSVWKNVTSDVNFESRGEEGGCYVYKLKNNEPVLAQYSISITSENVRTTLVF